MYGLIHIRYNFAHAATYFTRVPQFSLRSTLLTVHRDTTYIKERFVTITLVIYTNVVLILSRRTTTTIHAWIRLAHTNYLLNFMSRVLYEKRILADTLRSYYMALNLNAIFVLQYSLGVYIGMLR